VKHVEMHLNSKCCSTHVEKHWPKVSCVDTTVRVIHYLCHFRSECANTEFWYCVYVLVSTRADPGVGRLWCCNWVPWGLPQFYYRCHSV